MVSVKVAYNMRIVKKSKLANIYGEHPNFDLVQVWPKERLTVTITSKDIFLIFTVKVDFIWGHKITKVANIYGENPRPDYD